VVIEAPVHLDVQGVGKTFGSTRALDNVSVTIASGTVHAFVGENGAGKSTLGRIIAGVFPPDQGELVLRGTPVAFNSPRQALERGIVLVAQELALVPQLSVAHNVLLGAEPRRYGFVDREELEHRFQELRTGAGFELPGEAPVGRLSIALQQQVEILRALARQAQLIVFDEPTAALSAAEAERFHRIVRDLAATGRTVILVSHYLAEVLELSDTVTILRDGRIVRTAPAAEETEASLISGMLGRSLGRTFPPKAETSDGPPALVVEGLTAPGVRDVTLAVRAGEIVGLAGLIGSGRTELARAIFGAARASAGRVVVAGTDVAGGPAASLRAGVAMIPESRKDDGLSLGRPVRENVSLASLRQMSRLGIVQRGLERERVRAALGQVTAPPILEAPAVALSGGNQQKLLFARAVLGSPRVLIADEPTRGVDVGAKREIYEHLVALAASGVAVLLISSEIEELLGLAHRLLVMRAGRVVAELDRGAMSEEAILSAAFGAAAVPA